MAKIWQISDGRSYVVNGDPGTTITYTNSTSNGTAAGKQATSIPAGATSVTFPSNGAEVEISSDTATIDQVFNTAAAGSGSSSGGSGSAGGVTFQIVDTLPSQGAAGVIYLVKVSETGDDKFEEWIWVDSAWESIGTTAVDPTTYAKLIGGNTFEGNQVINGDLTVTGDVSGVTESNYNVVETAETTITPTGGTWVRYTGSETALTIEEPGWDGEAEISYIETATPVDLQGVTWSPAKPILTGNGPFVYTLVHAGDGQMLAGAYGYSTPTAEAIQAVAPMNWERNLVFGRNTPSSFTAGIEIGSGASSTNNGGISIGSNAHGSWNAIAIGNSATAASMYAVAYGANAYANAEAVAIGRESKAGDDSIALGERATSEANIGVAIGAQFSETVDGSNVSHTCTTEGTGSITIGAGANTLNTTTTVDGVETTVESSNAVTIGCKAENKGADSITLGAQAVNSGAGSVVIGSQAETAYNGDVIIGAGAKKATSWGDNSVAVGRKAQVVGSSSISIGNSAKANTDNVVVVGANSTAGGLGSIAIGNSITSNGIAIGSWPTAALKPRSVAIGNGATTNAQNTLTFGAQFAETVDGSAVTHTCTTEGTGSITIGAGANTLNNGDTESSNSITIGCKAKNQGYDNIVIGAQAECVWPNAVVIGTGAKANHVGGVVIGKNATTSRDSVAIGVYAAGGANTVTLGLSSTSAGQYSTAVGCAANSQGQQSLALGGQAKSAGKNSVAAGYQAQASNLGSIAIGSGATITDTTNADNTVTPSENTTVIGYGATASAPNVVVLGAGASGGEWGAGGIAIGAGATTQMAGVALGLGAKCVHTAHVAIGEKAEANSNGIAVGKLAKAKHYETIAFGESASAAYRNDIAVGYRTNASNGGAYGAGALAIGANSSVTADLSIGVGMGLTVSKPTSLCIGAAFSETVDGTSVTHTCSTEGTGSITIGAGANTLNTVTTDAEGTETTVESSNAITIGCKAENHNPDSIVIGAAASLNAPETYGSRSGSIVIGSAAQSQSVSGIAIGYRANTYAGLDGIAIGTGARANPNTVAIGSNTDAGMGSTAIGYYTKASQYTCLAVGSQAQAQAKTSSAFGVRAIAADEGVCVFSSYIQNGNKTQLYFSGANTPLANQYYGDENGENGEAFMGYTVTDNAGTVLACGTRRLSELFTDNTLNQAATIDEETGDYVLPTVFHPSDLDMQQEEPTEETEEYQTLPVYPIVEPEIEEPTEEPNEPEDITINIPEPTIPEPEEYTPLPVYPIVEPEDTTNIPESEQEPYTPLPVYPIVEPEIPTE